MYNPSDNFPPTFVRDWRQLLHNKGYLILMALVYVVAWMVLLSLDWASLRYDMAHPYDTAYCWLGELETHVHDYGCYRISRVCREMAHLNTNLAFCGMCMVALLIPLRIGNSVAADTKVKGTSFLQVTPLTSKQIVYGMWASAFSQTLLVAVLALPLILVRGMLMSTGNEADWCGLFYLVLAGGVFSAAYMFISGLNNLLRYPMMAGLIGLGIAATSWACFEPKHFAPLEIPAWGLPLHALAAGLVIYLLLQLTRRFYAAPAENMSLPLRWAVLLCLAVGAGCFVLNWNLRDASGDMLFPCYGVDLPAIVLLLAGAFGALMDCLLPVISLPVHAKRTLPGLPTWPQTPGMIQSAVFLLLPCFGIAAILILGGIISHKRLILLLESPYAGYLVPCVVSIVLALWTAVILSVTVSDLYVRRSSSRRPLVIAVTFVGLFVVCAIFAAGGAESFRALPMVNIIGAIASLTDVVDIPHEYTCYDYVSDSLIRYGRTPEEIKETLSMCTMTCIAAVVEASIVFALLVARVNSSRSAR